MSWIQRAKAGDKVVAIGNPTRHSISIAEGKSIGANQPVVGKVYSIREIDAWGGDIINLRLVGIDNSHLIGHRGTTVEPGWHYSAFRPVEPRKTDISVFTDMLKTAGKPVKEVA